MSAKTFSVKAEVGISIADQTIDDIIETAHYGISYWCSAIDVVGKQLGEYPYEQISRGGSLILYDAETSDKWELTREKFLSGIKLWLERNEGIRAVIDGEIDAGLVDANQADIILQYALFGELVFG